MEMDRAATLAALRARVSRLERPRLSSSDGAGLAVHPIIDDHLPGGSLPRASIHDIASDEDGSGVAFGFLALLAGRTAGTVLWIAPDPDCWPPGLARHGLDPAQLVLVQAKKPADGLWAMEEALRCPAVSVAILASTRAPDLTASRRLQIAAEAGDTIGFVHLPPEALDHPSASTTRWRLSPAPGDSTVERVLGRPGWQIELVRSRGGRPGAWRLHFDADTRSLLPTQSAEAPALPAKQRRRA